MQFETLNHADTRDRFLVVSTIKQDDIADFGFVGVRFAEIGLLDRVTWSRSRSEQITLRFKFREQYFVISGLNGDDELLDTTRRGGSEEIASARNLGAASQAAELRLGDALRRLDPFRKRRSPRNQSLPAKAASRFAHCWQ